MRINFEEIPNRVLKLYNELQRIVFDKAARNGLFLWNSFEADLEFEGYTIAQFARLHSVPMTSPIWRNSRIGYYGPKGTAIIMHTLIQLFPLTTLTDAFQPLSLRQYFAYFVIPHIACRLIAEDLSISATMNAYKVMVESSNVGELINPERDDDNELDLIKHRTMLVLRQRALGGRTIHDAAKALVSLQMKTPDVPDASVDQSNPRPRAKPHVILYPPKRVAACGASDHEEASENQVCSNTVN
ncbi:hypothetical protein EDC04DRAFT_2585189 [Pisolithus marmoratus]|nr:hypothetical protein EDC04DRAFT_2585189 [Pisolithus marmoratus]